MHDAPYGTVERCGRLYFLPLLLATIGYLILESRAKHLREKNQRKLAGE